MILFKNWSQFVDNKFMGYLVLENIHFFMNLINFELYWRIMLIKVRNNK